MGGDANDDGVINLFDLTAVAAAYDACVGDLAFDGRVDINRSGCVDILDLVMISANYHRQGPTPWTTALSTGSTLSAFSVGGEVGDAERPASRRLGDAEDWNLRATGMHEVYGVELTLSYDSAEVMVVDADPGRPGTQIKPGSMFAGRPHIVAVNQVVVDEPTGAGTITFAAALLGPAEAISGRGAVVTIPFEPVSPAAAELPFAIQDALFLDRRGRPATVDLPTVDWATVDWAHLTRRLYMPLMLQ